MWFLECDGDKVLDNKRIWLRPGTQFLLGRTHPKAGSPGFYVEHPSVSRQHLLVAVDNVKPGDSAHLHVKSKLTITDNSKIGTVVDGTERLSKNTKTLIHSDHVLKLGNYPDLFRIKWQTTTFSVTALSKSLKRSEDPLATFRDILEPLDIKCIGEYITQYTSHLVTIKRNTSAVLQALVNGRHVVTEPFLDALAAAGQKSSAEEQSPLEVDFAANWPRELLYLPPPGKEPYPRPAHSEQFSPNEARAEMFGKYVFIFHDQAQHDTLMPVITGGGGKCLVRQLQPGATDVEDMIEFVREVAGKKGDSAFDLTQQVEKRRTTTGGIVVMRFPNSKVQMPGYYESLDERLGQRSMEQNELLDAILDVDAGKLKREVERVDTGVESEGTGRARGPSTQKNTQHEQPASVQRHMEGASMAESSHRRTLQENDEDETTPKPPSPSPPVRRRAARQRTAPPKFRGFDDFEPEASMAKYEPPSPSQTPIPDTAPGESQSGYVDPMEAEYTDPSQSQLPGTQRSATQPSQLAGRKRRGGPLNEERETTQDVVASITKGANAMKKRRLEELERQKASLPQVEDSEMPDDDISAAAAAVVKKPIRRKKVKEMDVMALVNERREAAEEARLRDEENLRQALEGMDVADIRNLAKVEEMEIVRRDPPSRHDDGGPSDRWDAAWNGRKNFKKFRRQQRGGAVNTGAGYERARTRVIVPLEEVHKKAYGVGEDYWLESVEETRRKEKEKSKATQSQRLSMQSQSQAQAGAGGRSSDRRGQPRSRSPMAVDDDSEGNGEEANEDDDDDNGTRFRRRIRNSRAEDKEAEDEGEFFPEEIAGRARDDRIRKAAATASASSKKIGGSRGSASTIQSRTQTQTQIFRSEAGDGVGEEEGETSMQGKSKRKAADQGGGAAKKARSRAGSAASVGKSMSRSTRGKTAVEIDDQDQSDEEDSLRFRRRKR